MERRRRRRGDFTWSKGLLESETDRKEKEEEEEVVVLVEIKASASAAPHLIRINPLEGIWELLLLVVVLNQSLSLSFFFLLPMGVKGGWEEGRTNDVYNGTRRRRRNCE